MNEEGTARPGSESPDKELWSWQYEARKRAAQVKNLLFEEGRLRAGLTQQERIEQLQDAVTRGKDARRFLASDFWKRDVEVFLKAEAVLKPWNPKEDGVFAFMKLVAAYIFGSGQARVILRLMEAMYRWDKEGAAAEKFLLAEAERRRQADAAKDKAEAARR